MYEIDRAALGNFIASKRKEKNFTQKDLANKLFISDKAISKWERGLSFPDITMLIPLSKILDVTVTELLKGHESEKTKDSEELESLVKKVIDLTEDSEEKIKEKKLKNIFIFIFATVAISIEYFVFSNYIKDLIPNSLTILVISFIFGLYFWIFAKEKLPNYYDENKISTYSDGIFRINVVGLNFNNSNWIPILNYIRVWIILAASSAPFITILLNGFSEVIKTIVLVTLLLGSLFGPIYVVGKRYE